MDAQHRHELQQNDLGKLTNQALPFFEQHGWKVIALVAAVVLGAVGGGMWYSTNTTASAKAWTQFDTVLHEQNPSSSDFAGVADKHPGTAIAAWSKLKEADGLLKSGLETVFTNRAASEAELKRARDAYENLVNGGSSVVSDVRERALFGLARTQESMSDGDTEAAAKTYAQLVSEFPSSIFVGVAKERIAALESPDAKDFYAWFHAQDLKPKEPAGSPFKPPTDEDDSEGDDQEKMPADETDDQPAEASDKPTDDAPPDESKPDETSDSKSEEKSETKPDAKPAEEPTDKPDDAPKTESP